MNQEKLNIVVVEDDQRLGELIREYLETHGAFSVTIIDRGDVAVQEILKRRPDLVILDLMLPGLDGMSVCRQVRPAYTGLIMMLTAMEDDMDQVAGLELGADDYVKKPVEPRVLLARIKALMRRVENRDSSLADGDKTKVVFGRLEVDYESHDVFFDREKVELSTKEFDLLWILVKHAGTVLNRDEIMTKLRGIEYDGLDRSIDISISKLRKKLGDSPESPKKIKTIWGQGYLFVKDAWN